MTIKYLACLLKSGLALMLTGVLTGMPEVAGLQLRSLAEQTRPTPPSTGTPNGEGDQRAGTRRPENPCPDTEQSFTAIRADKDGANYTRSAYPTFVFYLPYSASTVKELEFLLLNHNERITIYRATISPPQEAGLVSVTIPAVEEYALASESRYHWYLNLSCVGSDVEASDIFVDGWVQKISDPMETAWYDTIRDRAQAYMANPQDPQAQQSWQEILQDLALDDLREVFEIPQEPAL